MSGKIRRQFDFFLKASLEASDASRPLNLENYFLLVIFLLPTYLVRFSIFGVPTNLWEVLAIATIILAAWKTRKSDIVISRHEKKVTILFLIIILGLISGMIKSGNYRTGLGIIKSWFVIPFAFAWLANWAIKNEEKAYLSLYLSSFLVAIIALGYKISGVVTYDGRLEAFYNSPNYLAMFLAPGIIIGFLRFNLCNFQRLNLRKRMALFSFIAILLVLFFTYSYAAWASFFITVVIIFLLSHKLSKRYLSITALIFIVLIFLLRDTTKFKDLVNFSERSSLSSRVMIWKSAGKTLQDHWLLGIGPGNFQEKYLENQKYFPPYLEWAVPHPHSLYLAFWLNAGLIGLLSFFALLYLFLKKALSGIRNDAAINLIALGIILYFLLHGLIDTTYFKNDLAVVFWLACLSTK